MKSPSQQIFDEMFRRSLALGYRTYDFAEIKNSLDFPFVIIGECQTVYDVTKSFRLGSSFLTIHIWGFPAKRSQVDAMAESLLNEAHDINQTESHRWACDTNATINDSIIDTTTNTSLLHVVLILKMKFS